MPVRRDKDGNIIEETTRFDLASADDESTRLVTDSDSADEKSTATSTSPAASADTTVVIGKSTPSADDEMTRAIGIPTIDQAEAAPAPLGGPVVGWLAVIQGPGRGNFAPLGYGRNSIGRAPSERVSLNFGDNNISRAHHAAVTYDPRGRKFYISHGDSDNLTYIGDRPVLSAEELPPHAHISIGETVLRFVPLCGDEFDWQDGDDGDSSGGDNNDNNNNSRSD